MAQPQEPTKIEMFEVALQFEERVMLSMLLLHAEASAITLGIVRDFRGKLSPTEQEAQVLKIVNLPDGRTGWDADADKPVTFKVGPSLKGIIVGLLTRANKAGTLTLSQLPLFEKFVERVEDIDA